jgi:hypothetical protein
MTDREMRVKVLGLIEELNPHSDYLTDDPDIKAKITEVMNQCMFELARFKKIPEYMEVEVRAGDRLTFSDIEEKSGHHVYQMGNITGVDYTPRADGTVLIFRGNGTAQIDLYVYPKRIPNTPGGEYVFALSEDVLEIMPYGVAADLLKSDISANYGRVYADRYETMLQRLDSRYSMPIISIEGGVT